MCVYERERGGRGRERERRGANRISINIVVFVQ